MPRYHFLGRNCGQLLIQLKHLIGLAAREIRAGEFGDRRLIRRIRLDHGLQKFDGACRVLALQRYFGPQARNPGCVGLLPLEFCKVVFGRVELTKSKLHDPVEIIADGHMVKGEAGHLEQAICLG